MVVVETPEASGRHVSWDHIAEILATGAPAIQRLPGTPECQILIGAAGQEITLRIPVSDKARPDPLRERELVLRTTKDGDQSYLELSTPNPELFKDFYTFACLVVDRVQLEGVEPLRAINETIRAWAELIRPRPRLTRENEIGLIGELWFLRYIADQLGWATAIGCWKGAESEEHDFGLPTVDVEIKTTVGETRQHLISSLTQMVPSPGRPLFLLSIQITAATADQRETCRLPTMVDEARSEAGKAGAGTAERLEILLENLKWRDDNHDLFPDHFRLRSEPALVPVNERFPALVPPLLSGLGDDLVARILQVTYRVNVEGLGCNLGSDDGTRLLALQ